MATSPPPEQLNEHTWVQASEWLVRFSEEEIDAAARERFNDWLRRSPENVHAYLQVSAFWQEADGLGRNDAGLRDIDALVARAKAESNVLPLALSLPSRTEASASDHARSARPTAKRFAVAASLLVAIGALSTYQYLHRGVFQTAIGEQRIVNLPDGSTMTLNADSRVKVRYTDTARTIDLDEGQALFKVAKNAARPFVVRSGGTSVRAVGTQFDVYKKSSGTVVTVVEGKVTVSDVLLSAGEQATVAAPAPRAVHSMRVTAPPPPVIHPVKLETATAWTEGLLVFEAASLAEVVQEFNRQNAKPLRLDGAGLETVRITGAFPASGSDRITRFLQERHGVVVTETDDEIRIAKR